jgi:hypothetical protein
MSWQTTKKKLFETLKNAGVKMKTSNSNRCTRISTPKRQSSVRITSLKPVRNQISARFLKI